MFAGDGNVSFRISLFTALPTTRYSPCPMETKQLLSLSPSDLRRAAEIKERIDALNAELAGILNDESAAVPTTVGKRGGGRTMSAAGRARIAAAARARWAKIRAEKGGGTDQSASKPAGKRRTMSPAARKKISEAAKARWAKIRAQKAKS